MRDSEAGANRQNLYDQTCEASQIAGNGFDDAYQLPVDTQASALNHGLSDAAPLVGELPLSATVPQAQLELDLH